MKERFPVSLDEQETIINLVPKDPVAYVYTSVPSLIARAYKLAESEPDLKITRDDGYGIDYEIPAWWVMFAPHHKRQYSEDQKQIMRERLKQLNDKRRNDQKFQQCEASVQTAVPLSEDV